MNYLQKISWQRLMICTGLVWTTAAYSVQSTVATELDDCMVQAMRTVSDTTTIGELRLQCEKQIHAGSYTGKNDGGTALDPVEERLRQDDEHVLQPFTLMAHKPNYLLFAAYNSSSYNTAPFEEEFKDPTYTLDDMEAKFQISTAVPGHA